MKKFMSNEIDAEISFEYVFGFLNRILLVSDNTVCCYLTSKACYLCDNFRLLQIIDIFEFCNKTKLMLYFDKPYPFNGKKVDEKYSLYELIEIIKK